MSSRAEKAEALAKKIEERRALLAKHLDAGKAKDSDVVRRDRKLLKRTVRRRRKLVMERRKKEK